jgi:hypothetical protein
MNVRKYGFLICFPRATRLLYFEFHCEKYLNSIRSLFFVRPGGGKELILGRRSIGGCLFYKHRTTVGRTDCVRGRLRR